MTLLQWVMWGILGWVFGLQTPGMETGDGDTGFRWCGYEGLVQMSVMYSVARRVCKGAAGLGSRGSYRLLIEKTIAESTDTKTDARQTIITIYIVKLGQREKKEAKRGEIKKRKTKLEREKKLWRRERKESILHFFYSITSASIFFDKSTYYIKKCKGAQPVVHWEYTKGFRERKKIRKGNLQS
jgi:hypothetical protein